MSLRNEEEFIVLILTHGRPEGVGITLRTMWTKGYTGAWCLMLDDEDDTREEYERLWGADHIEVFSKEEVAATMDEGDNFGDRRCAAYARNAAPGIAARLGYRYFLALDDDYDGYLYRFDQDMRYKPATIRNLDAVWGAMFNYYRNTPQITALAMSQGGDFAGGGESLSNSFVQSVNAQRKAMNSFFCDVERPFSFLGKLNEDANTYTTLGRRGALFMTLSQVSLHQLPTQSNPGGVTETYLEYGTYVKSFYSLMHCPSAVRISLLTGQRHSRIHHRVRYNHCAPKILAEAHRK